MTSRNAYPSLFRVGMILMILLLAEIAVPAVPALSFDHYYDNDAVVQALQSLNKSYPDLTQMRSLGKSEEGREVWLFTINNPGTGIDSDKPGIYVDGTIHGNEIQATEVCLYLAYYLLTNYKVIPAVTELVDKRAFYLVPIVNVDGRARFFLEAAGFDHGRSGRVPFDDDRDGLIDEDDNEDIDGDGEILEMRVRDPYGGWKTHPDDPRVMVQVKPGEKGEWRRLGDEGIDNDGDSRLNEDGPGYLDLNRNYGFKWQPPYVQSGSGDFPTSGTVTRAIADFVVSKPNICFAYSFHNSGGLWVRGPGSKLAGMYSPQDVAVYDYLGQEGEKIVPGYRYVVGFKDMYSTHGDFGEFMYSTLGIYGFVGELFTSSQEQYRSKREPGAEKSEEFSYYGGTPGEERQKFNDRLNQGAMFKDWTPFKHPQYGEIEIGGWRKFTTRIPPTFMLQELVHRNASMVIFTAKQAPDITLELIEVKDLGQGLHRVRVRAANANAIPSLSSSAMRHQTVRADIFSIEGRGIEVVSGGLIRDLHFEQVDYVEYRPRMLFSRVPSFDKQDLQWIVKGKGQVTVTYDGIKTKNQTLTFEI